LLERGEVPLDADEGISSVNSVNGVHVFEGLVAGERLENAVAKEFGAFQLPRCWPGRSVLCFYFSFVALYEVVVEVTHALAVARFAPLLDKVSP